MVHETPRPGMRRGLALVLALVLLLTAHTAGALSYYRASPQGKLGLSRPVISQQFTLEKGESIVRASMWLDGNRVEPTWDASGLVSYTPPAALAPGVHTVRLSVEVGTGIADWFYDPVVSTFSFTVDAGAVDKLPAPGAEELRALQRVNQLRRIAGLAPMSYSAQLGAAAGGHARYLAANPDQADRNAHGETAGTTGYFGATPGQRVTFYGYAGGSSEVIHFTDKAEEAVDGWMDTLYHRLALIHPGNTEMGYGLAVSGTGRYNVVEAGPAREAPGAVVPWPAAGQTGVPTGWDGGEVPNPFRLYSGVKGPVGYTITLTFGDRVRSLTLDSYRLTGPEGQVKVMAFDPAVDDELTDTVSLIPYAPLTPGATYTVTMAGQVDSDGKGLKPYSRTWSFTTASESVPLLKRRVLQSYGGTLASVAVEGSGFGQGMQAYLGGLPVTDLDVESGGRLTFVPPAGLTQGDLDLLVITPEGREATWPLFVEAGEARLPAGSPFREVPLLVHGQRVGSALQHRDGPLLVPEAALRELGALPSQVAGINRTYWTWAGRTGDYTLGRVVSTVGEFRFAMSLPVQQRGGTTYVESEFVERLTLTAAQRSDGEVSLGLRDLGGHWARPQVIRLLREGIVGGVGAGLFQPDAPLTRAAFVKMLTGARGMAPRPGETGGFSDTRNHWVAAQGFIGAAVAAGVVVPAEYPGGRFLPDQAITREEMAVMVTRALGLDSQARLVTLSDSGVVATVAGKTFSDASLWRYGGYVKLAVEKGIITGYPETDGRYTFRPDRQATRAEAAVMIGRALDL